MAVGTTDTGKPAAWAAAVQAALDDSLDNRAQEPVLLLESALVLRQKTVEVMK